MTSNQIAYWNYRETKRHNIETEKESKRHNVSTESISLQQLEESKRHNVVSESLGFANLQESHRHNLAQESIGWYGAYTTRSLSKAQIGTLAAQETLYLSEVPNKEAQTQLIESQTALNTAELPNKELQGEVLKTQAKLNTSSTVRNYVESVSTGIKTVQNVINPWNWVTPSMLFE